MALLFAGKLAGESPRVMLVLVHTDFLELQAGSRRPSGAGGAWRGILLGAHNLCAAHIGRGSVSNCVVGTTSRTWLRTAATTSPRPTQLPPRHTTPADAHAQGRLDPETREAVARHVHAGCTCRTALTRIDSLAGLFAGLAVWALRSRAAGDDAAGPGGRDCRVLHDCLEAGEDQRCALGDLRAQFRAKARPICTELDARRTELIELIAAEPPDTAAIAAKRAEIMAGQDRMQALVVEQLLAEKAVLNPEQREVLFGLLRSRPGCRLGPDCAGGCGSPATTARATPRASATSTPRIGVAAGRPRPVLLPWPATRPAHTRPIMLPARSPGLVPAPDPRRMVRDERTQDR